MDGRIVEHVRVDGATADGIIVRGGEIRVRYRIRCDDAWRVKELELLSLDDDRRIALGADGQGRWSDPGLEGCIDVDIEASPFTNTIAICRLRLAPGESADIRAAFVSVSEFHVTPARQRYTRLAADRYRYDGLDTDFTTELPVDADGLVIDYPDWFRRVWPR